MIKGLKDAQITDGLPRVLAEQPWVRALSLAMLELHRKTMDYIDASQVYTAIDTVAEEVLDALAVNWKIDWYDTVGSTCSTETISSLKVVSTLKPFASSGCALTGESSIPRAYCQS